jgi:hypothetical protein
VACAVAWLAGQGCGPRGWPLFGPVDNGTGLRAQAFVLRPSGKAALREYRVRVTRGPAFRSEHRQTTEVWRSQGVQPLKLEWQGRDTLIVTVDRESDTIHRWRARGANRLRVQVRTVVR